MRYPLDWFTTMCGKDVGINVIRHGDPEPDQDGRYVDRYGDIWEWDDDNHRWVITFGRHGKLAQTTALWVTIPAGHFPLTELHA